MAEQQKTGIDADGDEVDPRFPDSSVTTTADEGEPDETVVYPPAGKATETAQALLKAADDLGYDPIVVRTTDGAFTVPSDVADAADLPEGDEHGGDLNATASQSDGHVGAGNRKLGGPLNGDDGDQGDGEGLSFRTKGEAEAYADEHQLDVDKSLKADDYKAAVVEAANAKAAGSGE